MGPLSDATIAQGIAMRSPALAKNARKPRQISFEWAEHSEHGRYQFHRESRSRRHA